MPRRDWRDLPSEPVFTLCLQSHPPWFSLVYNWNWVILAFLLEFCLVPRPLLALTVGCWCRMMMGTWAEGWISLQAPTHLGSYLRCLSPSCYQIPRKRCCNEERLCLGFLFAEGQSKAAGNACDRSMRLLVTWHLRSGSRAQTGSPEQTGSRVRLLNSRPAPSKPFCPVSLYLLKILHRSTLPSAAGEPVFKPLSLGRSFTVQHNTN